MIDYGKRALLGTNVDAVDHAAAIDRLAYFARRRRPYTVSALAVHGIVEAANDPSLRAALNNFDLVVPDGQAVRWALNGLHGLDLVDKVPGPAVVESLLEIAADEGLVVQFYGSTPTTLTQIRETLVRRYGGALTMHMTPSRFAPVDADELDGIVRDLNATGAHMCFVGLGCPRQERFVAAAGPMLEMPALAVGAAFDYLAGTIRRAPRVVQRVGLEWLYRLGQEPARLTSRYATTNSAFLAGVAGQYARSRARRPAPRVEVDAFRAGGAIDA